MADPPKPPEGQGDSYLRTIAMSPDGNPPDDVKLAREQLEEAARVEAMMKAPRVRATMSPKKPRNGFLIATIVLVILGAGAVAFYLARKPAPAPVTLPAASSASK